MSTVAPQAIGWLVKLRAVDPLTQYIAITSAGIVWVVGLGWANYVNPVTYPKTAQAPTSPKIPYLT
jgi:hypothetical protein